jgi:hypothetical protein
MNTLKHYHFTKLSDYFMQCSVSIHKKGFPSSFMLDLTPYVSDDMKKESWTYELIGIVWGNAVHVKAYIKDQFEEKPQWYLCDDLSGLVRQEKPTEEAFKSTYIAVYKRIHKTTKKTVDTFARALSEIS